MLTDRVINVFMGRMVALTKGATAPEIPNGHFYSTSATFLRAGCPGMIYP